MGGEHDPAGLIELTGGPNAMVAKLDKMLTMEPTYHVGRLPRRDP